jgi:N-acetylmuramate 1-kinase
MNDAETRIQKTLHRYRPSLPSKKLSYFLMHGDASARRYVRIRGPELETSLIAMVLAAEKTRFSEEVMRGPAPTELPFINLHRYLARIGVLVPEVLFVDESEGILLLQDLGDDTMGRCLTEGAPREPLYEKAVDLLVALQAKTEKNKDDGCLAFQRAFEFDLLRWELDHFREYLLETDRKAHLSPEERLVVDESFDRIAKTIAGWPRGFTHRDYQSRNLMVVKNDFYLIDFQDALLGPSTYDLVALLRDSYVVLTPGEIDRLIDRYLEGCAREHLARPARGDFRKQFDLLTLQRKLKDAGRFVFIDRVKKNKNFLPFIPASLGYVREAFSRIPELQALQEILGRHVPELLP